MKKLKNNVCALLEKMENISKNLIFSKWNRYTVGGKNSYLWSPGQMASVYQQVSGWYFQALIV